MAPSGVAEVENVLDRQPAPIPALDIIVDDLQMKGRKLGRVEVEAVNRGGGVGVDGAAQEAREWRLNKLNITVPEARFTATGNWAVAAPLAGEAEGAQRRRTAMNFQLDMADSGALLTRFGLKDAIRNGKGKLEGQVSWDGSPFSPDVPTLGGQFNLNVENGQFLKADPGGTSTFSAVLETLTHGVTGDAQLRTFLARRQSAGNPFLPGTPWTTLKSAIESEVPGLDLDSSVDTATFDAVALAAALDQAIIKTRDGAAQAAQAITAAIGRAEDFIYVETPALDALAAGSGDGLIDVVSALVTRLGARPALAVVLCVPENFLPGQPRKLEAVRVAGVRASLKALQDAAPNQVVLFTPTAGPGRPLHMASTTVVVDDAWMLTGSTHLWRRGMSFDSSLAVVLFDENVVRGRPTAIRQARRQLMADRLGVDISLIGDDMAQLRDTVQRLNLSGGLQRVQPNVYPAAADSTSSADLDVWNPDGRPGGSSGWLLFLGSLAGNAADEVNNAIR